MWNTALMTTTKFSLRLLHLLDGLSQVDGFHGDLNFADTTEEICDEDAPGVPQEKVSAVARSGHTLTLGTHFELGRQMKHKQWIRERVAQLAFSKPVRLNGKSVNAARGSSPTGDMQNKTQQKYEPYALVVSAGLWAKSNTA